MSDHQARSIANDKTDPSNYPEDAGYRPCQECGESIKIDLMNTKEAEVVEYDHCYEHLPNEELREEIYHKVRDIKSLYQRLKERDEMITSLNRRIAYIEGQVLAHEANITKKNDQVMELLDAVRFLKTCLDEKKDSR